MIVKSLIKIAKTDPWILNHDHSSGGEIACVCPGETTPGDDLVEQDHDKVEDVGDDLDDGDIDDVAKQWWGFSTKKKSPLVPADRAGIQAVPDPQALHSGSSERSRTLAPGKFTLGTWVDSFMVTIDSVYRNLGRVPLLVVLVFLVVVLLSIVVRVFIGGSLGRGWWYTFHLLSGIS